MSTRIEQWSPVFTIRLLGYRFTVERKKDLSYGFTSDDSKKDQ